MSAEVENAVARTVAAWLTANRPAGLASSVQILAEDDQVQKTLPALVVTAEDAAPYGHRHMIEMSLGAALEYQGDDTDPDTAAGWMYAVYCALEEGVDEVRQELRTLGYWLRKATPMESGGNEGRGERGRMLSVRWRVFLQTRIV